MEAITSSVPEFLCNLLSIILGSLVLDNARLLSSCKSARLVSFLDSIACLRSMRLLYDDVPVAIFGDAYSSKLASGGSGEL